MIRALVGLSPDPQRALWVLLSILLACQLFLVILHFIATVVLADLAAQTVDGHISGFDLDSEGTLAVWFSSLQFLLIGLLCLFISWFDRGEGKRHRPLLWKYGGLVFTLMSIDETAVLHETFGGSMVRFFPGIPLSASMWWAIPYGILLGIFMLFLLLTLRQRFGPLALVLSGGGLWLLAVFFEMYLIFPHWLNVTLEEGAEMLGALCFIAALAFFLIDLVRNPRAGLIPGPVD